MAYLGIFGIWNTFLTNKIATNYPWQPKVSLSKISPLFTEFKLHIWRFLCIMNQIIYQIETKILKSGKIEVNRPVIPTRGIHILSYTFE